METKKKQTPFSLSLTTMITLKIMKNLLILVVKLALAVAFKLVQKILKVLNPKFPSSFWWRFCFLNNKKNKKNKNSIKTKQKKHKLKIPLLPPLEPPLKTTILLDLDQTLIHATKKTPEASNRPWIPNFDFIIPMTTKTYYVLKRPGVDMFLESLAKKKSFEIVLFTSGTESYAAPILDKLDTNRVIMHKLYRSSCRRLKYDVLAKDLSALGRDIKNVVLVDDNPQFYRLQPENGLLVRPFTGDLSDCELKKLTSFFDMVDDHNPEDIRDEIKKYKSDQSVM